MNRGRNTAILAVLGGGARRLPVLRRAAPRRAGGRGAATARAARSSTSSTRRRSRRSRSPPAAGETTTLRKVDNAWRLTAPIAVPADQAEATGAASNLATADVQSVVDEQPKDLAAFGLAKPQRHRHLPRGRRQDAADAAARRQEPDRQRPLRQAAGRAARLPRLGLPRGHLRQGHRSASATRRILTFDREKIDRLDVAAGTVKTTVARQVGHVERRRAGQRARRLRRHRSGAQPARQRPDEEHRLGSGRPGRRRGAGGSPAAASARRTLKEFGLDPAEHRLTLGAGSTVAEILLGKATPEGDVYAKDASRSIVFTIEKALADDLARNPADFRVQGRLRLPRLHRHAPRDHPRRQDRRVRAQEGAREGRGREVGGGGAGARRRRGEDRGPRQQGRHPARRIVRRRAAGRAPPSSRASRRRSTRARSTTPWSIHQAGPDYYAVRQGDAGAAKLIAPAVTDVVTALDATAEGARRHAGEEVR